MIFTRNSTLVKVQVWLVAIAVCLSIVVAHRLQAQTVNREQLITDVRSLVEFGVREAGTPAAKQASQYLADEYRKAGYETRIQSFTYPKFRDLGSSLTVNGTKIDAWAMNDSIAGQPTARLVAVPNFGRSEDFKSVPIKGAIAIVRRGEISFSQKTQNATEAGAIGLIVVNNTPGNVRGTLTQKPKIPVLALSQEAGTVLLDRAQNASLSATLNVNVQQEATGRNVIALIKGATQPRLILGAHYDTVSGSPGANDNASGSAVILAIARQISQTPMARQIWFVAFDGEEDGLKGSDAFVESVSPEWLAQLRGMLNFDMVGVNRELLVEGSATLSAYSTKTSPKRMGSSDHAPFKSKLVPVMLFYRGMEPNYHSPNDKTVDPNLLVETQQTAFGIVDRLLKN